MRLPWAWLISWAAAVSANIVIAATVKANRRMRTSAASTCSSRRKLHGLRLRLAQAGDDGEEIAVVGRKQAVPDEEVDQHKIAVVLEVRRVPHRLEHPAHRPQLEGL